MKPPTSSQRRRFQVEDLYLHLKITALHCTPHGEQAVCVVRSADRQANTYRSKLWLYELDGKTAGRQITFGCCNDLAPRWSPQGDRLAFVSDRDGPAQVYLLHTAGGEAQQLTHRPGTVFGLKWMPDGRALVATACVAVDPDLHGQRMTGHAPSAGSACAEVAWRLPYKSDGVGYLLSREIHLFRVDASTGEYEQLSDGPFNVLAYDVSPDGKRIAYTRTRDGRFAHATDLWVCSSNGTNHTRLTHALAHVLDPVWSPNGRYIAFTGAVLEGDAEVRLWLFDTESGTTRPIGSVEVADTASVHWENNSDEALVFVRAHCGRHQIARKGLDGKLDVLLEGDRQIGSFGWTGAQFAFAVHHPSQPCELHVWSEGGTHLHQVSHLNTWWQDRVPISVQAVSFEVPKEDGGVEQIEGWLMRAEGSSGCAPLLNDIHGGPASYALLDFDTTVYWQVLCSKGWAVLALNAVGSASFGSDFIRRLEGHWGTLDLPQHMAAIEKLQADGLCDERVAICGKSYGGYLAAWALGHTEVFKAAVVMAPVGNIETHYGTSDSGYYVDPFFMRTAPGFDRAKARSLSPLQYIEKARTPTLFMQGKDDERCPKCQSEELFVSLMRAGNTPAELVLYPNEGHGFLAEGAPVCRADAGNRIVAWIEQHVLAEHRDTAPRSNTGQVARGEQTR